ncbi:MAG TPA: phosphoribosylglycinamide formyltransferase [Acidimicrobiales bacterium]
MEVAVLVSGSGSILQAMFEAGVPVGLVAADRSCRALEIGTEGGVAVELVDRRQWGGFGPGFDREGYTRALTAVLVEHRVGLVAMAGFGTILDQPLHAAFPGRVLNTHPALLPAFPGWHAVRDALAAGVTETGCTVHLASLAVDSGPVLAQEAVPVLPGDSEASLHERIKVVERRLYPATVLAVLGQLRAGRQVAEVGS